MRILLYSYNYFPEPIGIAPLMTELAEGLVKRGHKVRVITGMPNYPERRIYPEYRGKLYMTEMINGVGIRRSYMRVRPQPSLIDRLLLDGSFVLTSLLHALKGVRPDVVLFTAPPLPVAVPSAILGWWHRCPVVMNLQDILPDAAVHVGLLTNPKLIRVFKYLEKFAYYASTKITVLADGFIDNLEGKQVPPDKIVKIPNWVDVNFIKPLPKENNPFRQKHQLEGKFVVLYSGNIALTQGLETVIEAATRLRNIQNIAFVIVGEQNALSKLQEYCQQHETTNVLLLPFQPREKLPEMLSAADVGLVVQKSNVISFNMPSKIQVLLASGRPIIGSVPEDGTAARAIRTSGGGIVVPPESPEKLARAIQDLHSHPDKVMALGIQSRRYAIDNYTLEKALDRYEELFEKLAKQRRFSYVPEG